MKFYISFLLGSLVTIAPAQAQYFYQDILATAKTSQQFAAYKAANIKKVSAVSFEKDGSETENFGIEQVINAKVQTITTITKSDFTGTHQMLTEFGPAGRPLLVTDSGVNIVNKTSYSYTGGGQVATISSISFEPSDTNRYTVAEQRRYQWKPNGELAAGIIVKNGTDSTSLQFEYEAGAKWPNMEKWFKNGQRTETFHYYYDEQHRLTDVVRYNERAKKMLPDYIFEYDASGNVVKQTIIQPGSNFYRNILFEYNEKGLKAAESIFYKSIEQEGRVVYSYE